MKNKLALIIGFVLLFAALGYFREFFFVNLNVILFMKYYSSAPALPVPEVMKVFENFNYAQLYYSKNFFTFLLTAIFFGASYWALGKFTANRIFVRLLFYSYAILLGLSFLSTAYGYLIKEQLASDEYTVSRWLMGVAQ